MTIDYCEDDGRMAAIFEAGDWLIDQAVERAIARHGGPVPRPPRLVRHKFDVLTESPILDALSRQRTALILDLRTQRPGKVIWMRDQRALLEQQMAAGRQNALASQQGLAGMYNAGIGSQIAGGPLGLGALGSCFLR